MGRGPRGQNQAIHLSAIPRRLSRPEQAGDSRYYIERIEEDGSRHRHPGYIGAYLRESYVASPFVWGMNGDEEIAIREEVAEEKDGKLEWVLNEKPVVQRRFGARAMDELADMREFVSELNKHPRESREFLADERQEQRERVRRQAEAKSVREFVSVINEDSRDDRQEQRESARRQAQADD